VTDDIVTRLRFPPDYGTFADAATMEEAADEIERLRTHMDALLLDNIEFMAKIATLQAIIDGRFESTSTTHEVRGE